MKCVAIKQHGPLEQVDIIEKDPPTLADNQILVRMEYAALNHLDLFVTQGWPGLQLQFPHILGSDGCGTIIDIGTSTESQFNVGERVIIDPTIGWPDGKKQFSITPATQLIGEQVDGTYCETIALAPKHLHHIPRHLTPQQGSALGLTFITAWRMLFTRGQLQRGETILIQGIGGGVANAALSLAKAQGCKVIVTSRHQDKLDQARALGADYGFLTHEKETAKQIYQASDKNGVDMVVDSVGDATWHSSLKSLRRGGRLVTCGATSGPHPKTDINRIFWNQLSILGSTMGSHTEFVDMLEFVERHQLEPVIDREFSLQAAKQALTRLEKGQQMGKIVLQISQA